MKYRYNFIYYVNGEKKSTASADNNDFCVEFSENNQMITLNLKPKNSIEFERFEIILDNRYSDGDKIFTNGYQSWTVSREYGIHDSMDEFNPRYLGIEKAKFNPLGIWGAGDLLWHKYPEKSGIFYGYSYSYIRNDDKIRLFGSLSERAGYTIITHNTNANTITIAKDLEGKVFTDDTTVLELAEICDSYENAFDKYFALMNISKPRITRSCGYTTWYNYYTSVTEDIVINDLKAISGLDKKVDIFQIDDGYERTVGDWLTPDKKKFPNGMKYTAEKIHAKNMLAGLWLAPFAVTPKSYIYKNHRDWLVKDKKGRTHYASHNWGGFYALDIYNSEVRAHLKRVFRVVLEDWGYDMVKLDFLYACCQFPIHNKTRGEIMCEAMDFIRECCGDKIILGCGVPLAPAFGKVDFCRIGADVGLGWENKAFSREDVSTQFTLTNTINRRHLDGRAWLNDPDVFLLRDNNIQLTMEQRKIIAKVNSLCGNLLFVSDDVSTYTDEQKEIFMQTVSSDKAKIISAEVVNGIAKIVTETETYCFDMESGKNIK